MKSITAKLFAIVAITLAFSVQSQAQDEPGTSGLVTVLDVAKVFEQNPTFKQQMDSIKSEADGLKQRIRAEQEALSKAAMGLQSFEPGSPERNQKEGEIEQRQAKLRTTARQSEQELLNREAKIYFDTYQTMQSVVGTIAEKNNISLVLRYDSGEIDQTNRPEVIKGVNRTVVYHRQLDLTSLVSKTMNERTASAGGTMRK